MSTARSVLIIGQTPDPHIEIVAEKIRALGGRVVVLDRHNLDHELTYTFKGGAGGAFALAATDRAAISNFSAIWWRLKPVVPSDFRSGVGSVAGSFRVREWDASLRSMPCVTGPARWVNDLDAHYRAARKPWQLRLAGQVGLQIPETLISNSFAEVSVFVETYGQVIYKTLSSFVLPPDSIVFSNLISAVDLVGAELQIALAPGIFQQFVNKVHDLRVTIVGQHCFAVKVHSQHAEATSVDWRRDQSDPAMYEATALPDETRRALLRFHKRAGLAFAAYDFAVGADGVPVFLECNPGGQWLWLEEATGLDISGSLSHLLLDQTTPD